MSEKFCANVSLSDNNNEQVWAGMIEVYADSNLEARNKLIEAIENIIPAKEKKTINNLFILHQGKKSKKLDNPKQLSIQRLVEAIGAVEDLETYKDLKLDIIISRLPILFMSLKQIKNALYIVLDIVKNRL